MIPFILNSRKDKIQSQKGLPGAWDWGRGLTAKELKETFRIMELFYTLIAVEPAQHYVLIRSIRLFILNELILLYENFISVELKIKLLSNNTQWIK